MPPNAVKQACAIAGSQVALARELRVSEAAVSGWVRQGWVPLRRAAEIEQRFGVARRKLVSPQLQELLQASAA